MNIIIAGDGKVGSTLAGYLSAEGHNLTVIDHNSQALELTQTSLDVMTVQGNCASMHTLMEAGAEKADLFSLAKSVSMVRTLIFVSFHLGFQAFQLNLVRAERESLLKIRRGDRRHRGALQNRSSHCR